MRINRREKTLLIALARLQTLVGRARSAYMDDRSPDRWSGVEGALQEAALVCEAARSEFPYEVVERVEREAEQR